MSAVLITGGTGTVGRLLTPLLRDSDNEIRVVSRSRSGLVDGVEYFAADLSQGTDLEEALDGVGTVVHLAGNPKGDEVVAGNLVRAAKQAGVGHLVLISVIAADRVPLGYFRMKHATEQIVDDSGIPYTTLRAAQFHDLVFNLVRAMAKLPVMPAPRGMRAQPVDARDVAERLAELALGEPRGLVSDLAGPTVYELTDLCRDYLRATGKRRLVMPIPVPGKVGRVFRAGENLELERVDFGTRTWEDFLADQVR